MKRIGLFIYLLATFTFPLTACFAEEEPEVRVLIKQDIPVVTLGIWGPYEIWQGKASQRLTSGGTLKTGPVRATADGILLGGTIWPENRLRVIPRDPERPIRINGRKFRGEVEFISKGEGKLWVVNRVGIEEYLPGVLGWEVGSQWPMEALKAQAVVSRTMVAHRIWISRGKSQEFDVTADVSTQVYGGKSSEKWASAKACRQTAGQVLAYQGELLSATFHANCGGHTEDATELWQTKGNPSPLKGRPDPYCKGLRHFQWRWSLPLEDLTRRLGHLSGEINPPIRSVEVLERNRSGRIRTLRLFGMAGSATLTGRRFRELLGADRLRSLKFTVAISGSRATFSGFGWGHGVGFCQWGAYGQARQGRKAEEILRFYFPESERRGLRGLPGFD